MSWLAVAWAETVPVADAYERCILTVMAHRARPDGTNAWPSVSKLARFAVCDEKTIERRLSALRKRGVIAYGEQKLAAIQKIPKNRRPKVYDLMIPFEWYSAAQLEAEVNPDREERGLGPLTAADRPPLAPPTRARKARADAGVPKPERRKQTPSSDEDSQGLQLDLGGLQDPPEGDWPEKSGGSTRPPSEGSTSPRQGGLQDPQYSPSAGSGNSPSLQSGLPAGPDGPDGPSERKDQEPSSVGDHKLELVGNQQTARARVRVVAGDGLAAEDGWDLVKPEVLAMVQDEDAGRLDLRPDSLVTNELARLIALADPLVTSTACYTRAFRLIADAKQGSKYSKLVAAVHHDRPTLTRTEARHRADRRVVAALLAQKAGEAIAAANPTTRSALEPIAEPA